MTTPSTFGPVYPAIDANGVSLTVYAEDGVTLIPAVGAIVPYAKYYLDLVFVTAKLRTSDPLGLSGDPITISAITRISAGLVGDVTSGLASRPGLSDGEIVTTHGYAEAGDNGGATWRFKLNVSTGSNGLTKINCSNGQWEMVIAYNQSVSLRQLGGKKDQSTTCASIVADFIAIRQADMPDGGLIDLFINDDVVSTDSWSRFRWDTTVTLPGSNKWIVRVTGNGAHGNGSDPFGYSFWGTEAAMTGSAVQCDEGVSMFDGDAVNFYCELHIRGIGIVGYGRGTAPGIRTNNPGNFKLTARNLVIANFYAGIQHEQEIYTRECADVSTLGCFYGRWLGADNPTFSNNDCEYDGFSASGCNVGIWVRGGFTNELHGGDVQGCAQAFRFAGDGGGYAETIISKIHDEGNGHYRLGGVTQVTQFTRADCVTIATSNDTLSGLAARNGVAPVAGQRVLVAAQTNPVNNGVYLAAAGAWTRTDRGSAFSERETHAGCLYKITGGTHANTFWQIDNSTPAWLVDGDPLVIAQKNEDWSIEFLTASSSGGLVFRDYWCNNDYTNKITPHTGTHFESCSFVGSELILTDGLAISENNSSFLAHTFPGYTSRYKSDLRYYPTRQLGSFSGTIDHNWGSQGWKVSLQTSGAVVVNAPTNMPEGAPYVIYANQGGAGGHGFTFGANIFCTGYSNVGNVAGSWCKFEFQHVGNGQWRGTATAWS